MVLSVDGSINGGTLGGTLLCPFKFCLLKQVVMSLMCSYYHHLNQIVTLHSSKSRSQIMAANVAEGCTFSRHRFVPQRS